MLSRRAVLALSVAASMAAHAALFLLAPRIAILHAGQLEQVGTKNEVLRSPATRFVRELLAKPAEQLAAFREML